MTPLVLRLPLPPSRNRGRQSNWRAIEAQKRRYWAACDRATIRDRFPRTPFPRVEVTAVLYTWNLNDEDNGKARMKFVQDWCKSRGIVKDDTPACWHYVAFEQVIERKVKGGYLMLTLQPVLPPDPPRATPSPAPTSGR